MVITLILVLLTSNSDFIMTFFNYLPFVDKVCYNREERKEFEFMALIKCNECGKKMSDHAKMCPNCGCDNNIMFCPECDKQLSSKASMCPNCGCPIKGYKVSTNEDINPLCLSGMLIGIISFFIDFYGLVSAGALVLSIVGFTKASRKNRTFAIIGIICSSIELVLKIIQLMKIISLGY